MKFIRGFFVGLFSLILINLIVILILSFNLKNVLIDGVIKETITSSIMPNMQEKALPNIETNQQVNELLNNKETQELINKYLDIVVEGLIDDENISNIELEEDIINYLKDNKEKISEITGEEITDEMIDEASKELREQDLNKEIQEAITNTNNGITDTEKTILKGYQTFISEKFRIILIIISLVDLILIGICQMSLYKWIKTLGISMTTSGVLLAIMAIIVKLIVTVLSPVKSFSTSSLLITSIVTTIVGIVIIIAYNIITKNIEKKEVEINEVS